MARHSAKHRTVGCDNAGNPITEDEFGIRTYEFPSHVKKALQAIFEEKKKKKKSPRPVKS